MQIKKPVRRRIRVFFKMAIWISKKIHPPKYKKKTEKTFMNFLENPNFQSFQKTCITCCRTMTGHLACQISGKYVHF